MGELRLESPFTKVMAGLGTRDLERIFRGDHVLVGWRTEWIF